MRRWRKNRHWLDASGLALYFLQRVRELDIEDAVPQPVWSELRQHHVDNGKRTESLHLDFVRLNEAFRDAGLRYVNLKGFTLVPEYCPDLTLRYQTDFDFLIDEEDAAQCRETLSELGYSVIAANQQVMEFKTDAGRTPHMRDLYRARAQRSVEVHLCGSGGSSWHRGLLHRASFKRIEGSSYPILSAEDMFLSQASHVLRHLRSEWTRISWLLEFRHFVRSRSEDTGFWRSVRLRAMRDPEAILAAGVSLRMAEKAFGDFVPHELASWSVGRVAAPVALWIEEYGAAVLLTDFPGSKLYLLLEGAIHGDNRAALVREKLFPRRAPAPIVAAPANGFIAQLRAAMTRWSYFAFRLRFHVQSGASYLSASRRWRRLLGSSASAKPSMASEYGVPAAD